MTTADEQRFEDAEETRTVTDGRHGTVRDGFGRIAAVARNEYRLSVRSRWAVALAGLFALFSLMLLTFSGSAVGPEGFQRVLASLTNLAVYLLPLAALAFGYDAVVGYEETGWLDVLFALPVARSHVVAGTYLGRAAVVVGATVIGFTPAGLLLLRDFGAARWRTYVVFVLAAAGVGLAFLSLAMLVSSVAREKAHALGVSLLVWVWFVLVHDLISLGVIAAMDLSQTAISAMVLANPADVFRVLVMSRLDIGGGAGFAAILGQTTLSTTVLVGALAVWVVVPVGIAAILVRRRSI